jgi:hypothetical protein
VVVVVVGRTGRSRLGRSATSSGRHGSGSILAADERGGESGRSDKDGNNGGGTHIETKMGLLKLLLKDGKVNERVVSE